MAKRKRTPWVKDGWFICAPGRATHKWRSFDSYYTGSGVLVMRDHCELCGGYREERTNDIGTCTQSQIMGAKSASHYIKA